MFQAFFNDLRAAKVPVSIREYLTLIEALDKGVVSDSVDEFYYVSRAALVKDERDLDFRGLEYMPDFFGQEEADLPADWLRAQMEKLLSPEEMADIGTSPFGNNGYNPEGIRIGQDKGRHGKAVKVWDKREFKNLDGDKEIGTRNIKVALRRLRKFAREGAAEELDLQGTINGTAKQGWLDIKMRPERRNAVKVLAFFDIGGSMDSYIKQAEELFSAARSEFKRLEYFYFHNCIYEHVWQDNIRRMREVTPTWDILHKYPSDYRVVLVGDAAMSPYEISMKGGSVEHWNEEAGSTWLRRLTEVYDNIVWINPTQQEYWKYSQSTQMIKDIIGEHRMFPMTLSGIEDAMKELAR